MFRLTCLKKFASAVAWKKRAQLNWHPESLLFICVSSGYFISSKKGKIPYSYYIYVLIFFIFCFLLGVNWSWFCHALNDLLIPEIAVCQALV